MHPAIPIVLIAALISLLEEDKPAPPPAQVPESPKEHVVLIPDADGKVGAVVITTSGGETVLDRAYTAGDVFAQGKVERRDTDAATVKDRFSGALGARPPVPVSVTVYFVFGKDELTPESLAQFNRIKSELASRPAPEVVVIGHTDRVGAVEYNDKLSLQRAEAVRSALISAGVDAAQIDIAGRGEREPTVPTADEVAEPRNRRVEIMVR